MDPVRMSTKCEFSNDEISRYSRQLILPEIGVEGQMKLRNGKVLIVGMGGLGCPCSMYLAAAGVGTIGLLDYDSVEMTNLHRQVLHTEDSIGITKVNSALQQLKRMNSTTEFIEHHASLNSNNALEIIKNYDVVIDASDNVPTSEFRTGGFYAYTEYLVNDACVMARKPLISGSALRFEGQLTIYNYKDGPCYRCLYPKPPPPETITNCSDGGVLGAVTGSIGSLQALETIKILVGLEASYCRRLLLFDGMSGDIRTIKLRAKKDDCPVCGLAPTIKHLIDYEMFCGSSATDKTRTLKILSSNERITVEELKLAFEENKNHILIDVRPKNEFDICSLRNSKNFPINEFQNGQVFEFIEKCSTDETPEVFVVCKQGNDSQKAVSMLKERFSNDDKYHGNGSNIKDIIGGLACWSLRIDKTFPTY